MSEPLPLQNMTLEENLFALQERLLALEAQRVGDSQGYLTTTVWLLVCGALVFFMQAGFAFVEAGVCRGKNVISILVKNQVDFICASFAWLVFGWSLAFGDATPTSGLIGTTEYFGSGVFEGAQVSDNAIHFHFQQMFCAVAATIVSGGIAERAWPRGYVVFSCAMSSLIYPVVVCWCWNSDGWLAVKGFLDFAGSGVVHLTGGMGALAGAYVLGPRAGRFGTGGMAQDEDEFLPHNVPFVCIGTMILQFGWYGFNAGSTLSMSSMGDSKTAILASVTTTMAAVAGGLVAAVWRLLAKGRWDPPYVCNGILAGCVSITASCAFVSPTSALIVGGVGGLIFGMTASLLCLLRIDDPIGAFPVHGACGFWGVLTVNLFHSSHTVTGELASPPEFSVQLLGASAICAYSGLASLFVFSVARRVGLLSSTLQDQLRGLDRHLNAEAYSTGEVSRYSAFISHAKSTHGATARWLQLELAPFARGRSKIFLDSDNLVNLNHLLATIRDEVDMLIVLATEEIWWRPWCAGEITVASLADVPIVLVMMGDADKRLSLDFDAVSKNIRTKIPSKAMEILAPFGINYEDVELAYRRLASMPQVHFLVGSHESMRDSITSIARTARLQRVDQGCVRSLALNLIMSRKRSDYVIIGDRDDMEAVAAMHICEEALLQASDQDSSFRVANCTKMSENMFLQIVNRGATMILVLSRGALDCQLVQRACLVRAATLWPDGSLISGSATQTSIAVLVDADHLGFEYPGATFYETLKASMPSSSGGPDHRTSVSSTFSFQFPYQDQEKATTVLVAFYKLLFQQIALPMSTHGSWKAIGQQFHTVYDRIRKMPRVGHSLVRASSRATLAPHPESEPLPPLPEETEYGARARTA